MQLAARRKARTTRHLHLQAGQALAQASTARRRARGAAGLLRLRLRGGGFRSQVAGAVRVKSGEGEMKCWGISGEGKANGSTRLGLSSASCGFVANGRLD